MYRHFLTGARVIVPRLAAHSPQRGLPAGAAIKVAVICGVALIGVLLSPGGVVGRGADEVAALTSATPGRLDRSGARRTGMASFYATRFAGRKMADGTLMRPQGDNAASLSLPLGTTALVTNLKTGRAAIVTIRDRGPYVKNRIVDLSPATARKIGLESREGLAPVEVAPIEVPLGDGTFKIMAVSATERGMSTRPGVWDN